MPCWELFDVQSDTYRRSVLGTAPRVAVEAAVRLGWDRWIGSDGAFVGMLTLQLQEGTTSSRITMQALPEAIGKLREACDRMMRAAERASGGDP